MIKILGRHKGLKTGARYYVKQDGHNVCLLHETTGKGIRINMEKLRKIKHEYVPDYELAM